MRLKNYLKDKIFSIIIYLLNIILIISILLAFKISSYLVVIIFTTLLVAGISIFLLNYLRKRNFYQNLITNLDALDKKYLVLETVTPPSFYEGKLLSKILYDIDKSMIEEVNKYKTNLEDFKDYIEMWIHEVKMPLATLILMTRNNKDLDKKYLYQLKRLDNYLDQVLYYVRSNYLEEDFTFQEVSLDKVITAIALKNKDDLLENNIDFIVDTKGMKVTTDYKWLEFIINQIINNSIKYASKTKNSYIKLEAHQLDDKVRLSILDNGKGISKNDLPKVFNKSFTGGNGLYNTKSTGMGLYIAKKLCDKLGHEIEITSLVSEYTLVTLTFGIDNYCKVQTNITKL